MTCSLYLINLRHYTHLQKSVKSADFFHTVILSLFLSKKITIVGLNLNSSKADWFYFAVIITKEAWLTLITLSTTVNIELLLVILNPTITVILMAKFNPTITTYLVPYIIEGCDNTKFSYWVSLFLKVDYISYTMGTHALPDIYTLALGPVALVYISDKALVPWYNYPLHVYILYMVWNECGMLIAVT